MKKRPIPAKGLTGPGYDGHTFWDSESFVLPVLILTAPDAAASALQWRHSTLPAAMERAAQLGFKGAAFPWRTITGEECSGSAAAGPGRGDRGDAHPQRRRAATPARHSPPRGPSARRTTRISASGLVGGGAVPAPGEATLAHHGVLFLDELSEFARPALEALRQPLEDGHVIVVRGQHAMLFPTRFMLVAATNPCPCGFHGEPARCRCSDAELARHRRRLSGPLLDRVDLLIGVPRPSADDLGAAPATTSAAARDRVLRGARAPGAAARRGPASRATPA